MRKLLMLLVICLFIPSVALATGNPGDYIQVDDGYLGSAATRDAEDTLTDGSNLPDGAAIKAYGDANWGGGGGSSAFDDITSGTNETATMIVGGSGAHGSISYTEDGTVNASHFQGSNKVLATSGGTGKNTWTIATYPLIYVPDDTTFAEIAIGTAGQVLSVNALADGYEWVTPDVPESTLLQHGTDTFNSTTGVTVTLDPVLADTDYDVIITLPSQTNIEDVGVISIESKAVGSFVVKNSGADTTFTFNWLVLPYSISGGGSGEMTYPGAGIALSTGTAWGTSIDNNSANWNTAYSDRLKWDGGDGELIPATGRTSLGLVIGTDVQAYHAYLADISGIAANQGDVIYFNGTHWVDLPPGDSGKFLKTQGADANPMWDTPVGGGDITSVVAGSGLTGGGTTGDVTLNIGSGTGITVGADSIWLSTGAALANLGGGSGTTYLKKDGTWAIPSVYTFNADNYGTHGTQAAIQAAIDAADDTGGVVFIPAGDWTITSGLIISATGHGVSLLGEGATEGGTVFTRAGGAFNTITITGNASTNYGNRVSGIQFENTVNMSDNYAHISVLNGVSVNISDLVLFDAYVGIKIAGSISGVYISNCFFYMNSLTSHGIGIYVYKDSTFVYPSFVLIDHISITGYPGSGRYFDYGIYVTQADVLEISDSYIGQVGLHNLYINGASANQLSGLKFDNCWFDSSSDLNTTSNVTITGSNSSGVFGAFQFTDCTFQGRSGTYGVTYGFYIVSGCNVTDVKVDSNLFFGHGHQAILFHGGSYLLANNNRIKGCSYDATNTYDGINVEYGVDYVTLSGNQIGGASFGAAPVPRYGISVGTGSEYFLITSNNCSGSTSGSVYYPSAAVHKMVAGNLPVETGY